METSGLDDGGRTAAHDLASIEDTQRAFARSLVTPRGHDVAAGVAAGLDVAAVGLVFGGGPVWRVCLGLALLVVAIGVLAWSVRRFRVVNGAWVSGLRHGRTLPTSVARVGVQLVLGFTAAMAAVAAGWWWLGLLLAPVQVIAYVAVTRRWMSVYRARYGADA